MCSAGDLLGIYKVDRCFEVLSPDSIDPKQTDPNAPWIVRHVSAYGAGNEIVARTVLQANSFLEQASFKDIVNKAQIMHSARVCRSSILECETISDQINSEIDRIVREYQFLKLQGNVITSFPVYEGLREAAGAFLLNAKQTLQGAGGIINAFFGQAFDGPHFHKIRDWLIKAFPGTGLANFVADCEPKSKWIVDLRNYFEHPGHQTTEIRDFYWEPETRKTHLPTWNITGDPPGAIAKDTKAIAEFLLDFVEGLIVLCTMSQVDHFPYILARNEPLKPEMPIRYTLQIDPSILSGKK
jgi:hypothetical protein